MEGTLDPNTEPFAKLIQHRWKLIFVNFDFLEKIMILFDFLQVYGLLWICAQPWPWPYLWTVWSRWVCVFNLDLFSLFPNGALAGRTNNVGISKYGDMDGYLHYALGFVLVELIGIAVTVYLLHKSNTIAQRWHVYRPYIVCISLNIIIALYTPFTLVVFRLYVCDADGRLSADPRVTCGEMQHAAITAFASICHLPVVVAVPWYLYKMIQKICIYDLSTDFEKRIQSWEITYLLGVNEDFMQLQCWTASSFKRKAAYYRLHSLILKLLLVCVYVSIRDDIPAQSLAFLVLVSCIYGYYGLYRKSYRCQVSNKMLAVAAVLLIANSAFGFANSLRIKNFLMVSSTESIVLLCVNGVGAGLFVLLILFNFFRSRFSSQWPALRTLQNIASSTQSCGLFCSWVDALKKANEIIASTLVTSDVLLDVDKLELCIRNLRAHWLSATSMGSIISIALSEYLELLLTIHSQVIASSLRRTSHWDAASNELISTQRFGKRHQQLVMMSDRKRRILTKLFSMRSLMSGIHKSKKHLSSELQIDEEGLLTDGHSTMLLHSPQFPVESNPMLKFMFGKKNFLDTNGKCDTDTLAFIREICEKTENTLKDYQTTTASSIDELISAWDSIIEIYELNISNNIFRQFSEVDIENWYTYRKELATILADNASEEGLHDDANDELDRLLGLHKGWNQRIDVGFMDGEIIDGGLS